MSYQNTKVSLEERFWAKVRKTRTCWLWTGCIKKDGHGQFSFNRKCISAQRAAWILTYGEILLSGICVCHTCPNRHCVRPSHLSLGSRGDNSRDGNRLPRGTACLTDYRKPLVDIYTRFWSYVTKTETCWLWIGHKSKSGYGCIGYQKKNWSAHRLSWTLTHGNIPNGLFVLHNCDIRACVNPEHLRLGTHADNMKDKVARGRTAYIRNLPYSFGNSLCSTAGTKNTKAVLTDEQVLELRALYKTRAQTYHHPLSYHAIAKRYNVTASTIAKVITGKTWKHLPL